MRSASCASTYRSVHVQAGTCRFRMRSRRVPIANTRTLKILCIGSRSRPFIAGYTHMMKTWSLPILAAFVLAPASTSAQTAPKVGTRAPAPAAAKGKVNIVCNPSCDDVVISGRSYGPSPVVNAELPAGNYDVTLKRKSQADTRKQFVVASGQTGSLNFALATQAAPTAPSADMAARLSSRLKEADGWLNIQCDPACDDVVVDGKRSLGKNTTNVTLPPGEHEITGKRKGAADKTIKVRVVGGQTTAVRLRMDATVAAQMDPVAMRKLLDTKVTAGTATQEDVKSLRAICAQQADKACVAKMDARLKPR